LRAGGHMRRSLMTAIPGLLKPRVSGVENAELNALLTKMTLADTDAPVAVVFIDNRYWLCLPVGNGRVLGFDIGPAAILNADAQAATIGNLKELAAVHGIDNAGL